MSFDEFQVRSDTKPSSKDLAEPDIPQRPLLALEFPSSNPMRLLLLFEC
jgi:hypothetical protein